MARSIVLSNGSLLVGLDQTGQVRDFYFPHVGHANHVSGASGSYMHRIGVWCDGTVNWLHDPAWSITISTPKTDERSSIEAINDHLGLTVLLEDVVHNEHNVFIRSIRIRNRREDAREVRIFFIQEFRISESQRGDTAFYDPRVHSIIHYKGHNAFLIHTAYNGKGFDDYTVGLFGIEGKEGSFADAEDGVLSKNAVEHGSVDSAIGVHVTLGAHSEAQVYYWIVAADSIKNAHQIHGRVLTETPERLIVSTERYWSAWSERSSHNLGSVDVHLRELYRHSLVVMKNHADKNGGIIASSDTDILNQGRDTYSYVWPRDSALTALALSRSGYSDVTERYFSFIAGLIEPGGYLMHKYRVDGVLGSSWHPWVRNGTMELPIQEDETALVLYALGEHYERSQNIEFIESLYNSFIEPAADFLAGYIDPVTNLPQGSYDLWEEKYGTSTYTASAVFGALLAATRFSSLLGKRDHALRYQSRAEKVAHGIMHYLYDPLSGTFVKRIYKKPDGTIVYDRVLDMSSVHGVLMFGVLAPHDLRASRAFDLTIKALHVPGPVGGYMRYEGDNYYRTGSENPPNPWCITTLWVAQQYIRTARTQAELQPAYEILEWVQAHASPSGMLPEQLNPHTGAHLSTSPLVWSHAEFVHTVYLYHTKYRTLKK